MHKHSSSETRRSEAEVRHTRYRIRRHSFCILHCALCIAVAAVGTAASGAVLYKENFTKCGDLPPGINPAAGAKASNEPIWSGRMQINVKPEADADVFLSPLALPADGAFDFFFGQTFLDPAKEESPSFDVVLVAADGSRQTLALTTNAVASLAAAQNAAPRVSRRFAFASGLLYSSVSSCI